MPHIDEDFATALQAIPLTILTGFLGAGKTTLLNRILNGNHGLRVAVLVNDFGAINIDAELVVGIDTDVISLANGCVCCTIRDDLVATVMQALGRRERPEYILLEASGVAEPSGLAFTFNNPALRERIRLDGILCVVDAEQVFAAPETMELKLFQMACADMVILNKVDLVDRETVGRIRRWLDDRFHRYRLVESRRGDVPMELLLSVGHFERFRPGARGHAHDAFHAHAFGTWSCEIEEPLSLERVRERASGLPATIYRAKGILYTEEDPERRIALQVVGKRVDVSSLGSWGDHPRRSQLVAIGAAGAIDSGQLRRMFESCTSRSDLISA